MRFAFIRDHTALFEVSIMLRVLNVSKSGFYAWLKRLVSPRAKQNATRYSRRSKPSTTLLERRMVARGSRLHSGALGLEFHGIVWHD